ncbi:MAG: hypothetical protein Q9168_005027, partial [Polycauliona sp. 1 TL-2023]
METPPSLEKQTAYIDPAFSPSFASQVKGLEIYARWDGVLEHPAAVSVLFTVQAQPSTHLQLLKTDDPLVVSHTICSFESTSTGSHGFMACDHDAELKELQGDTLTTTEAKQYIHAIEHHEARSEEDSIDNSPLRVLSSSALNREPTEATSKANNPLSALTAMSDDRPKRGPSFSGQENPQVLIWDENGAPQAPNRTPSHPQRLPGLLPTPADLPTQRPGRFKVRSGRHKLSDFVIHEDQPHVQGATPKRQKSLTSPRQAKPRKKSAGDSCRNPQISSTATDKTLPTDTPRETRLFGATHCFPETSRYYGTLPLSRPALARSVTSESSDSASSVTTVVKNCLPLASDPCVGHQTKDDPAPTYLIPNRELLEAAFSSPVESYAVWVDGKCYVDDTLSTGPAIPVPHHETIQCWSPSSENSQNFPDAKSKTKLPKLPFALDFAAARHPTTVAAGDALYVHFPSELCPDTYRILLDLDVLLSEPDTLGWQRFKIPGLPIEPDSDVRGFLQFQLMSLSDHSIPIPPAQFDSRRFSIIRDAQESHIESDFPISEPFSLPLRLQTDTAHIREWNSNVAIYSSFTYKSGQGVCMKNYANLSIETMGEDLFARRARFSLFIRNGSPSGGTYKLKPGQCSINLSPYQNTVTNFDRTVEIWIERDQQDMEKPLRLEFTCFYPGIQEASILMPVVFPSSGKVLSEKLWVFKPMPPLVLHPVIREFLSTWTVSEQLVGSRELLSFVRKEMPPRYPHALSDDAVVRLRSHNPVSFVGLEVPDDVGKFEKCSNIIPSLHYIVDMVPQKRLECRMVFELEVGSQQDLLRIEALEWVPKFSRINGRINPPEHSYWWEEDDQLCLLKAPWMVSGNILHIEMAFIMIGRLDDATTSRDQFIKIMGTLPRITDKVIFGGDLVCNIDDAVVTLVPNQDDVDDEEMSFWMLYGENTKRMPLLRRGYKLELMFKLPNPIWRSPSKKLKSAMRVDKIRFCEGLPLATRTLRFADEMLGISSSEEDDSEDDADDDSEAEDFDGDRKIEISGHDVLSAANLKLNSTARDDKTGGATDLEKGGASKDEKDSTRPDDIINDPISSTEKATRQNFRHQICGSDASSSSSDEDLAEIYEWIAAADLHDDDDEDQDWGLPWFLIDIARTIFLFLILLAELAHEVYRWMNRVSPMRFAMRFLVVMMVCATIRQYSPVMVWDVGPRINGMGVGNWIENAGTGEGVVVMEEETRKGEEREGEVLRRRGEVEKEIDEQVQAQGP